MGGRIVIWLRREDAVVATRFMANIEVIFVPSDLFPYHQIVGKYSGECLAKFIRFQSRIRGLYNLWLYHRANQRSSLRLIAHFAMELERFVCDRKALLCTPMAFPYTTRLPEVN